MLRLVALQDPNHRRLPPTTQSSVVKLPPPSSTGFSFVSFCSRVDPLSPSQVTTGFYPVQVRPTAPTPSRPQRFEVPHGNHR